MTPPTPITLPIDLCGVETVDGLLNKNGPLKQMFKQFLEHMLEGELTGHLGYSPYSPAGHHSGNSRNGKTKKNLKTSFGTTEIGIPRDRQGSFEPQAVRKYQTTSNEIEDKIIAMYARGMTTRDIEKTLTEIYGIDVSPTFISDVTDKVLPLIKEWQSRPLEAIYPIIFLDAIHYKVRENGRIVSKAAYLILGINLRGEKDILGIWIGEAESAKFWLNILTELKSRGVEDILIACTDGLPGFEEAIHAAYPDTVNQLCVVHQIRNSLRYISTRDVKTFLADLKKVYQAATREEAEAALDRLETTWGERYPLVLKSWKENWDRLSAYFDYPAEIRRLIYTTNLLEGFNRGLRKVTKNRAVFPNDEALRKLLYLAAQDIVRKWTMPLPNWGRTISQLAIHFSDRIKLQI